MEKLKNLKRKPGRFPQIGVEAVFLQLFRMERIPEGEGNNFNYVLCYT
jgi:hypothetical protein